MIEETISKLEARLRNSQSVDDQARRELLGLLGELKSELSALKETDARKAESITEFTARSTVAATGQDRGSDESLKGSLQELASSVDGFEKSHPQLVQLVNRIATTLSNLGI